MFTCEICKQTIGPAVKPVRVITQTRAAQYHNEYFVEDEWGNREKREVDSQGSEIVRESIICPADAIRQGIDVPPKSSVEQVGVAYKEKQADPMRVPFIVTMVHNALTRVGQATERAKRDSMIAVPIVKWFTETNPKFVI